MRDDHHLDYAEDGSGKSHLDGIQVRRGAASDREQFSFRDILLDWQLQMDMGSPAEMMQFLGLAPENNSGFDEGWQDIFLGKAAPGPEIIRIMSKAYEQTRVKGMVSKRAFDSAAFAILGIAKQHGCTQDGFYPYIVHPPRIVARVAPEEAEPPPSSWAVGHVQAAQRTRKESHFERR